jgi:hypothetical protein
LAGRTNVQLTVALAATDADFETFPAQQDFLNIYLDPVGTGNFTLLSGFTGNAGKSLEEVRVENGALALDDLGGVIFTGFVLSNQEFRDYTVALPLGNANAVIRFEASSTFANEIVALDDVRVAVATAPLLGDFNNNGAVDAADYVLWRNGGPLANEGGVTPGTSTAEDYTTWRSNFGRTSGSGSASGASGVPEPASAMLMLIAALDLFTRRGVASR